MFVEPFLLPGIQHSLVFIIWSSHHLYYLIWSLHHHYDVMILLFDLHIVTINWVPLSPPKVRERFPKLTQLLKYRCWDLNLEGSDFSIPAVSHLQWCSQWQGVKSLGIALRPVVFLDYWVLCKVLPVDQLLS